MVHFYEVLASGVGQYFDSLYSDIDSLGLYAVSILKGPRIFTGCCRFPYAIYYTMAEDLVSVHAILDCRQDPAGIERLSQTSRRWGE